MMCVCIICYLYVVCVDHLSYIISILINKWFLSNMYAGMLHVYVCNIHYRISYDVYALSSRKQQGAAAPRVVAARLLLPASKLICT